MMRYRLAATRGWTGEPLDTASIYSERDEPACGYEFQVGQTYIVYAYSMKADSIPWRSWPDRTSFPVISLPLDRRTGFESRLLRRHQTPCARL